MRLSEYMRECTRKTEYLKFNIKKVKFCVDLQIFTYYNTTCARL